MLGKQGEFYLLARTLYAPLSEEPAKLWPLWVPFLSRRLASIPAHRAALAIGLGFGVGEAWTVAGLLANVPEIAAYPWWQLGGYISERLMVCVMHAAFTASALVLILRRGRVLGGVAACVLLHFVGNFPLYMAARNVFGWGPLAWGLILQVWVVSYFLAMASLLAFTAYGKSGLRHLFRGRVRCPECQALYVHPLFGINLLHKSYERCPHCRRWHLVDAFGDET